MILLFILGIKNNCHISYYIVQHFIAMDCHYCQDIKLLCKNEKNTMHVNKLGKKVSKLIYCLTFSFSFVIQRLALRTYYRGGIEVLEVGEWISA